ncbi:hypothetical protein BJH93_00915 [Kocuria polaris]|nr:hypothetical protein [Kocuria polaris]
MITAPIHASPEPIVEWARSARFAAAGLDKRFQFCVVLSEQGFEPGDSELVDDFWPSGAQVCWLGGPAALASPEDWPRSVSGEPLAHVVTIDLACTYGVMDREFRGFWRGHDLGEDLPKEGFLQVFFLLGAFGHDAEDGAEGAWQVRWSSSREGLNLVQPPEDLDLPSEVCQLALPMASFSIPSPLDVKDEAFEAAEAANESYQSSWNFERTGGTDKRPFPVSRLYGHSDHGEGLAVDEVLPEVLPLDEGDEYRLVLEVESWSALEGWFGDVGTLEVWMRRSDLLEQRFENAWCILRTD